jgi:hypothetical protein
MNSPATLSSQVKRQQGGDAPAFLCGHAFEFGSVPHQPLVHQPMLHGITVAEVHTSLALRIYKIVYTRQ